VTETDLLNATLDLARLYGWRTLHIRPARTAQGWRSAVMGDGVGFPDILAVRKDQMLAVELKALKGKTTIPQREWLIALKYAGADAFVWTPAEWESGEILATLAPASQESP
jgi:hypothetical protein